MSKNILIGLGVVLVIGVGIWALSGTHSATTQTGSTPSVIQGQSSIPSVTSSAQATFTLADVAAHHTASSCYAAIDGSVRAWVMSPVFCQLVDDETGLKTYALESER